MKRLLLLFLFFGCLGVQTNRNYDFEIYNSTNSFIHLEGDAIFSYSELSFLNRSEFGAAILKSVEIVKNGNEEILVVETNKNITQFAFDQFMRFLPFFGEESGLPNRVYQYNNKTIVKIDSSDGIGFFEGKNKIYIGKEAHLWRILNETQSSKFDEISNGSYGNFVYLTDSYPFYQGFKSQTIVFGDVRDVETGRMKVKMVLNPIKRDESQMVQYLNSTNVESYYYQYFNTKPHLSVERIDAKSVGTTTEINLEIVGYFNELIKYLG